jgi:hypothetical protein
MDYLAHPFMKTSLLLCLACAVGTPMPVAAEPLGRLFFTPEQRMLFDRQRQHGGGAQATLRFDGIAARSGAKPTVWINGLPQEFDTLGKETLRPGESLNPVTREKTDVVPGGSIRHSRR